MEVLHPPSGAESDAHPGLPVHGPPPLLQVQAVPQVAVGHALEHQQPLQLPALALRAVPQQWHYVAVVQPRQQLDLRISTFTLEK